MGTKLCALLFAAGSDPAQAAAAALKSVHDLIRPIPPRLGVPLSNLRLQFSAPHPETGVRLAYLLSSDKDHFLFWGARISRLARAISALPHGLSVAAVRYDSIGYCQIVVCRDGSVFRLSHNSGSPVGFKQVLKRCFRISWSDLEEWYLFTTYYDDFGVQAREMRFPQGDLADAVQAYRAGASPDAWPFKTSYERARSTSRRWAKTEANPCPGRMFLLASSGPAPELFPVPREVTPDEYFGTIVGG